MPFAPRIAFVDVETTGTSPGHDRITEIATNKVRIIEATSVAHAMKHVAETTHKCEVAGGVEAVKLIAEGVKFESAVKGG